MQLANPLSSTNCVRCVRFHVGSDWCLSRCFGLTATSQMTWCQRFVWCIEGGTGLASRWRLVAFPFYPLRRVPRLLRTPCNGTACWCISSRMYACSEKVWEGCYWRCRVRCRCCSTVALRLRRGCERVAAWLRQKRPSNIYDWIWRNLTQIVMRIIEMTVQPAYLCMHRPKKSLINDQNIWLRKFRWHVIQTLSLIVDECCSFWNDPIKSDLSRVPRTLDVECNFSSGFVCPVALCSRRLQWIRPWIEWWLTRSTRKQSEAALNIQWCKVINLIVCLLIRATFGVSIPISFFVGCSVDHLRR